MQYYINKVTKRNSKFCLVLLCLSKTFQERPDFKTTAQISHGQIYGDSTRLRQ